MIEQIRLKFSDIIKQETVRIPDTFDPLKSLPTLLQHESLFMADHTVGRGNNQWPNCKISPRFREIISTLVSFGRLHLDIVTLNVENITQFPAPMADLHRIENLNTTLYVAFTQEYTTMLGLDGEDVQDATWPLTSMQQFRLIISS
jgi:hypothetical protein